jgi:hypothetical protein
MAYSNGRIYMFGGELQPRVPVPAATYVCDLASGTWRKLETARDSQGQHLAQSINSCCHANCPFSLDQTCCLNACDCLSQSL